MKIQDKIVYIDNSPVHYTLAGEGKSVLILHGWLSSSRAWKVFQEKLSADHFRVIVPDLPGFGQTPLPNAEGWSLDNYLQWVQAFTNRLHQDKILETPFALMGHSFGGRIAIKAAALQALPLASLILVDAAGLLQQPRLEKKIFAKIASGTQKFFEAMNIPPKLIEKFRNLSYQIIRQKDYLRASEEVRKTFRKIVGEDLISFLPKIQVPTLIVWGQKDNLLPVQQAYILQKGIAHSQLTIIPEARHSPQLQSPEQLLSTTVKFLQKND